MLSSKHIWCLFALISNIASKLGLPIMHEKGQRNFGKSAVSCCLLDSRMYLEQSYTPMVQDVRSMSIRTGPTNPYRASPFLLSLQILHCLDCIKFQSYFSFCKNQHPCTRSYHPLHFLTCVSRVNPYRYSFFVNAPFVWNALPGSILRVLCPVTFRSSLINRFC